MKKTLKKWAVWFLRIGVSAGLIAYIFIYLIDWKDRVETVSGQSLAGRVLAEDARTVRMRLDTGEERTIPRSELKPDPSGKPGAVRQGFLTILRRTHPSYFAWGLASLVACYLIGAVRWWVLLHSQNVPVTVWQTLRWTFVGMFFNNVLPGSTGGDLAKAFYVARETHAKTRAVVSVFVDRVIGLFSLALLCGFIIFIEWERTEFRRVALFIYSLLGSAVVAVGVAFSRRIRRALLIDSVLKRLPLQRLIHEVDEAVLLYRDHKAAILLTVVLSACAHVVLIGCHWLYGRALSIDQPASTYFILVPVVMMVTAVPISQQGLGVGEAAFAYLFSLPGVGVPQERAVAVSITYRLTTMLLSLVGGLFVWRTGRVSAEEVERELGDAAGDAGPEAKGDRPADVALERP